MALIHGLQNMSPFDARRQGMHYELDLTDDCADGVGREERRRGLNVSRLTHAARIQLDLVDVSDRRHTQESPH